MEQKFPGIEQDFWVFDYCTNAFLLFGKKSEGKELIGCVGKLWLSKIHADIFVICLKLILCLNCIRSMDMTNQNHNNNFILLSFPQRNISTGKNVD